MKRVLTCSAPTFFLPSIVCRSSPLLCAVWVWVRVRVRLGAWVEGFVVYHLSFVVCRLSLSFVIVVCRLSSSLVIAVYCRLSFDV